MFLKFDFTNPGVFGKIFWDILFYIEVKKLTPSNAKERRKEQNAGRNGTPEGTEHQKERNARRNGTPEGTERQKERNAGRNGMPEGMLYFDAYFNVILLWRTLTQYFEASTCTSWLYFDAILLHMYAKERQGTPRNAKKCQRNANERKSQRYVLFFAV
jgi:hypothetical protein